MKRSSNRFTAKKPSAKPAAKPRPQPAASGSSPWRWALPGLILLVAAAGTWAVFEFFILSKLPPELVGKWVVVGGAQDGATFDFFRRGKMLGRINVKGREAIIDARVRVEDKVLDATTTNPDTGARETREQIIVALTAKNLVLEDERGNRLHMERADEGSWRHE